MDDIAMEHGLDPRDVYPCDDVVCNAPQFNQYFDRNGNVISRKDFTSNQDFEAQVEFIVLPTGDCISTAYGEWSVVAFENEDTEQEELTLAKPKKIYRDCDCDDCDCNCDDCDCDWVVEYTWIKSDREHAIMTEKHGDVRDIFYYDDDDTVLSLQSFQGALRLYNLEELRLPYYTKTSDMLRRWCRGRVHEDIGFWTIRDRNKTDFVGVDVYDVLELYFAKPQLIGRTRLGAWMWQHFLQPLLGNKHEPKLLQKLLCTTFVAEAVKCETHNTCVWCGMEALVRVETHPHGELFADLSCLSKMQRFVAVGCFMRVLRAHKQFSPQCVAYTHNFMAQFKNL